MARDSCREVASSFTFHPVRDAAGNVLGAAGYGELHLRRLKPHQAAPAAMHDSARLAAQWEHTTIAERGCWRQARRLILRLDLATGLPVITGSPVARSSLRISRRACALRFTATGISRPAIATERRSGPRFRANRIGKL
jgi:hypothetical protein